MQMARLAPLILLAVVTVGSTDASADYQCTFRKDTSVLATCSFAAGGLCSYQFEPNLTVNCASPISFHESYCGITAGGLTVVGSTQTSSASFGIAYKAAPNVPNYTAFCQ
jgi:hypothetical protein